MLHIINKNTFTRNEKLEILNKEIENYQNMAILELKIQYSIF